MIHAFHHEGSTSTLWLLGFTTAIAIIDLRCHRIPNTITVTAALIGLTAHVLTDGTAGALHATAGFMVGLGAFMPFYLLGGFGAGDVKAMGAVGAFLGPTGVLIAAGCTLVAGALGAVLVLLASGGAAAALRLAGYWSLRVLALYSGNAPAPPAAADRAIGARDFPYGLAIACGTVASLAWS